MTYSLDDLRTDLESAGLDRAVHVECGAHYDELRTPVFQPVGETAWIASTAGPEIAAIVGYADLREPAASDVLDAHIDAGAGRFRGVRQVAAWDGDRRFRPMVPDPGPSLLADPAFRRGFGHLAERGLSFDAYVYFPQLPEVTDLAREHADTTIVLDHLGGPIAIGPYADRSASLTTWRRSMAALAACDNVYVKLGGVGMSILGLGWHKRPQRPTPRDLLQAWQEPVQFCIDHFGTERCMFESNFPVDRSSFSYADLWTAYEELVPDETARRHLFHDTAATAYRLPAPTPTPPNP